MRYELSIAAFSPTVDTAGDAAKVLNIYLVKDSHTDGNKRGLLKKAFFSDVSSVPLNSSNARIHFFRNLLTEQSLLR
jgi:hypothetical protein